MASRFIVLDKNLGVRPIGIGEVVRRIIAKAVLSVVTGDIQRAAGALQLFAEQISGVEAAIHSMWSIYAEVSSEGVLLIYASNAFNSAVVLRNIQYTCPTFCSNFYHTY